MRENRSMAGEPGKDLSRWKLSLFILCMLLGLWAGSVTASAAADLCEGVSAVSKNQVIYMGKTTDSAAFDGMTAGNAIPWLVVNKNQANNQNPSGMYLVSRDLLGKNQSGGGLSFRNDGDNSTDWMGSNVRAWCQDFYKGAMTPSEQNAVLKTSLSDGGEYHTIDWNFQFDPMTLSGEEIFFLSAEEAEIFFYPSSERAARYNGQEAVWLLRSPKKSSRPKGVSAVGAVYKDGKTVLASVYRVNLDIDTSQLPEEIKNNVRMIQDLTRGDFAARPAFNLDKTKVLFSSAAKGGKLSDISGVTGLTENTPSNTDQWKLTLLDESLNLSLGNASLKGNLLSIPYSEASTGNNRYVSGIVKNAEGKITYYGRLADASSGTILVDTFLVNIGSSDKLYLFVEECNGDGQTDYAGELKEVTYSTADATNAYDEGSLVPLEIEYREKGTVAIGTVKSNEKTILLTGAAVVNTAGGAVSKPVCSITSSAFSNTSAGTVEINLRKSATSITFMKRVFSGSKVKKLVLTGTNANLFAIKKGAFRNSRVRTIVVKGMSRGQYEKMVRKIRKAGYKGKIKR